MGKPNGQNGQGQGQGHSQNAPQRQTMRRSNINNTQQQTLPLQGNDTSDILGSTRDLLYGGAVPPSASTDVPQYPQHPPPVYDQQNMAYMAQANSAQTTQYAGQVNVPSVNTGQFNGQANQPYNNQTAPQYRPGSGIPGMQHGAQTANGPGYDNSMPAWASGLCQQIGNLQSMIGEHAQRWQTIENSIVTQNQNICSMSKQLSEVTNLKQEIVKTNARVYDTENNITKLRRQMTEYDETINDYSDMCDEITTANTETDKKMKTMESRLRAVERKVDGMDKDIQETNEKLTDVRWRSMRENLLFFGIKESDQPREDCEQVLKDFIKDKMKIEDTPFDRVHRLGRYNRKNARPRPIVAKFTFYKDKELVRITAPGSLEGTNFGVSEQYPAEIEDKRKPLYSIAKKAREYNNKVKLVRDKLYINDQLYKPEQTHNDRTDTYTHDRNDKRQSYDNNRRHGNDNRNNDTNGYQHEQYTRNDDWSTHRNTRRHGNGNRDTNRYQREQYSARGSRVFTRSAPSTESNANRDEYEVPTRNTYTALSTLGEMAQQTTPYVRKSRGAKNKATSPLDRENTAKKQNLGDTNDCDETFIDIDMTLTASPTKSDSQRSQSLLAGNTGAISNAAQQPPPMESASLCSQSLLASYTGATNNAAQQSPPTSSIMTLPPSPVITIPVPPQGTCTPTQDSLDESVGSRANGDDQSSDNEAA